MSLGQTINATNNPNGVTVSWDPNKEMNNCDKFYFDVSIDSSTVYDTRWLNSLAIKVGDIDLFNLYEEDGKAYFSIHFYDYDDFTALKFLNNLKSDKELKEIRLCYTKTNNKHLPIFQLLYSDFDGVEEVHYNIKSEAESGIDDSEKSLILRFNKVELEYTQYFLDKE